MRYAELTKELRAAGCYILRHGKQHDIWYSPITGRQFSVPRHMREEVPAGTLKSIRKSAGL
ncbi:MAG: type II toxin-antitoxin system HicA family toxin [Oscillospiraceae bacterium]|uniref:Toxin HicA n=1 Tax=Vescimonas coprocola TaxID=2714355 RepID=A0A810Q5P4_9FIRM|nr:type II toxin-antitoxin system HicA family toxin [Vescimonas coprocola]MBS5504072.1 type II toxin-antitoxin system HicA family toxin [Bacillota bacterium]MEE0563394.1 type II toxin-antitoxin system HicA family toxin [Oscillospiraceae bacterium]DAI84546.1 MAG TPA: hypothetical protein [Caudoviricetes sp.]MEE1449816.1 type II toxin-antitoxin system HicA family toxin [Oscillospiraceae bacterium]BCK81582.1 toxin HicA [Vescimonas coprocola]